MIAKNANLMQLEAAAAETGVRLENVRPLGRRWGFVLRLAPDRKWQRRSWQGRRIAAVSWHGHRDFFRALFRLAPNAIVTSHWAAGWTVYTAATFEATYRATGAANIGSMMQPVRYADACDCGEGIR
jgi:hypothetical protein